MNEQAFPMAIPIQHPMTRRARLAIAGVALLAFFIKILLALKTYGTNDVYVYDHFSVWSRYLGVFLYRADPQFNHPPSMIHILHAFSWLAAVTGLPFSFWLRLPGILADTGSLWIVWKMLGARTVLNTKEDRSIFWSLILLAAAPPLILISGFHGNTDSVVIFFVLLSIYLLEIGASGWLAGAAFAMACCFKVFPVIVVPVMVLNASGRKRWINRRSIKFCAAALIVLLICWSPFFFQDPKTIVAQVFGYRSLYGHWGLSYLALQLPATLSAVLPSLLPRAELFNANFERWGSYLALGLVLIVSWRMNWGPLRPRLFSQVGLIFLLFLSVSNGFGVQYLAWLVPWVVELGWLPTATFYTASGIFLFLVYNYWSQGLPWYLADSINVGEYTGYFDHAHVICWLSVVAALSVAWRRVGIAAGWDRILPIPPLGPGLRIGAALVAAAALWAVIPPQMDTPSPPGGKDARAVRTINARSDLDLSMLLAGDHRYEDSIRAAREALALTPDSAEAHASIAAGYAGLGMWRDAVENAQEALRVDPDFEPARNILASAASNR
jgi:tetratricopeptide (TPR) repeat protein